MHINNKNIYYQSKIDAKDLRVKQLIKDAFKLHPAYGHRRLAIYFKINKKRILRVMNKFSLKPPRLWYQKKYITVKNDMYDHKLTNLIKNIINPKPNDVWVTDLTYIKYQQKYLYLSVIQDICTNEVLACNLGSKHDSVLVLQTIREAVLKQNTAPKIFHSDRGKENLADDCLSYLKSLGTKISVSDTAAPWQNGHVESFFSRFKSETGNLKRFEGLGKLTEYIYHFINYYNHERIVTRLKTSPVKYKQSLRMCS